MCSACSEQPLLQVHTPYLPKPDCVISELHAISFKRLSTFSFLQWGVSKIWLPHPPSLQPLVQHTLPASPASPSSSHSFHGATEGLSASASPCPPASQLTPPQKSFPLCMESLHASHPRRMMRDTSGSSAVTADTVCQQPLKEGCAPGCRVPSATVAAAAEIIPQVRWQCHPSVERSWRRFLCTATVRYQIRDVSWCRDGSAYSACSPLRPAEHSCKQGRVVRPPHTSLPSAGTGLAGSWLRWRVRPACCGTLTMRPPATRQQVCKGGTTSLHFTRTSGTYPSLDVPSGPSVGLKGRQSGHRKALPAPPWSTPRTSCFDTPP